MEIVSFGKFALARVGFSGCGHLVFWFNFYSIRWWFMVLIFVVCLALRFGCFGLMQKFGLV